jgi:DNA primase
MVPGLIPEDRIQQVLDAVEIVELVGREVELRRAGSGFKGLCPFHDEKTPSFHVSPERGTYHCFGCSRGGNVFGWIMERLGMTFPEAVRMLAAEHGIEIEETSAGAEPGPPGGRARILEALEFAAAFFHKSLGRPDAGHARSYLADRGFRREVVLRFRIGYAPDAWDAIRDEGHRRGFTDEILEAAGLVIRKDDGGRCYDRFRDRLVFPIGDVTGRIIGFGARILGDGEPKYLNSPDGPLFNKGRTLFGLDFAKDDIRRRGCAVLVEGYTDVLMAHQVGRADFVAGLGTALTRDHARLLRRFADSVTLLYDGDDAGRKAASRAFGIFLEEELAVRVAFLPKNLDPCEVARDEGPEGLESRLDEARTATQFLVDLVTGRGRGPEDRARALDGVLGMIAQVPNPVRRELLIKELAEGVEVSEKSLLERTRKMVSRPVREEGRESIVRPQTEEWALESALVDPADRMPELAKVPLTSADVRRIVDRAVDLLRGDGYTTAALLTGLSPDEAALVTRLEAEGVTKKHHDRQFSDSLDRIRQASSPDGAEKDLLAEAIRSGDTDAIERQKSRIRGRSE